MYLVERVYTANAENPRKHESRRSEAHWRLNTLQKDLRCSGILEHEFFER
ncbi:hypothetical protein NQ317_007673 [Molorchus minor]|uniref:Uncharacterized protein n=1 Tax=Molorchus minor TaxID=1323400 RepID=A0ABQ9J2Q1_9CUCU|nr:hypothetical protein NQ317_007673 [Molorchus minor]